MDYYKLKIHTLSGIGEILHSVLFKKRGGGRFIIIFFLSPLIPINVLYTYMNYILNFTSNFYFRLMFNRINKTKNARLVFKTELSIYIYILNIKC